MAEHKGGPVKPPTLDLKARAGGTTSRSTESSGEAAKPTASGGAAPTQKTQEATAKFLAPFGIPLASALGGGVLGVALSFGLASAGFWPGNGDASVTQSVLSAKIAALAASQAAEATRSEALEAQLVELSGRTAQSQSKTTDTIAALRTELAALRESDGNAAPQTALFAEMDALKIRMAELDQRLNAASLSAATGEAITPEVLASLQGQYTSLAEALEAISARTSQTDAQLARTQALIYEVLAHPAPVAEQSSPNTARLGLALSGLDHALRDGTPFVGELAVVMAELPEVEVPPSIAQGASEGLPDPRIIARDLNAVIPAMLAAKPADPQAGWTDRLIERVAAMLALRPVGNAGDDSPEANIARLELGISSSNFAEANAGLAALPPSMRDAAGALTGDIQRLADAESFVANVRRAALATGDVPE